MTLNFLTSFNKYFILLFVLMLSACAGLQTSGSGDPLVPQSEQSQIYSSNPGEVTPGSDAYHLMVAEIAIHRGQTDLAVKNYLIVAKSQNNPDIAERAVRIAVYGE
ncbi:MAG: hypothetical protein DRQ59_10385, partial [Gammaproteobacteria bacterium]